MEQLSILDCYFRRFHFMLGSLLGQALDLQEIENPVSTLMHILYIGNDATYVVQHALILSTPGGYNLTSKR